MHHPEAPEISDCEVGARLGEEPDGVKEGDRKGAVEEEVREIAIVLDLQLATQASEQDDAPEHQAHDQ